MPLRFYTTTRTLLSLTVASAMLAQTAGASSCKTQAQISATERNALSSAASTVAGEVQRGEILALQANTIPAIASDFSGIAASVVTLKPLLQQAAITVDSIYALDDSTDPSGNTRTDFYCGTPLVTLNFSDLPPGSYALVILHAT